MLPNLENSRSNKAHVRLRDQVDDPVHVLFLHQFQHALEVAEVHLYETVVRAVLDVPQVRQAPRVGQFVQVEDAGLRVFVHEQPHDVRADESSAAGDDYVTNISVFVYFFLTLEGSRLLFLFSTCARLHGRANGFAAIRNATVPSVKSGTLAARKDLLTLCR